MSVTVVGEIAEARGPMAKKTVGGKNPTVGFTADPELKRQIEELAELDRRPVSQWLRIRVEEIVREERARYETELVEHNEPSDTEKELSSKDS